MAKTAVKRDVEYMSICPMCGRMHYIWLSEGESCAYEGMVEARRRGEPGPLIQEALPDLPKEARESLISGYCPDCQRLVFSEPDDGFQGF